MHQCVLGVALLAMWFHATVAGAAVAPMKQHPLLDVRVIQLGVAAARKEVQQALRQPADAFDKYLTRFAAVSAPKGHPQPGGPTDSKSLKERLKIFTENLRTAANQNANSSDMVAFGITPFTHLTQQEYEKLYLGQSEDPQPGDDNTTITWTPLEPAASRKLLNGLQAPASHQGKRQQAMARTAPAMQAPATVEAVLQGQKNRVSSGTVPAQRPKTSPNVDTVTQKRNRPASSRSTTPAAPQLAEHDQAVARLPVASKPLPWDPDDGAGRCSAERNYPHGQLVPPPAGVNWVLAGGTTAVKDQGLCGSCVAFATVALAEFMHMRKYGTSNMTTDLSEQDLLDCTLGDGCTGQHQAVYADLIGCVGVALEQETPYRVADAGANCRAVERYSGMSHGDGGGWAAVAADPDSFDQALSTAPVMVTLDATAWALYRGGVLGCDTPGSIPFNHAVVVVGFLNQVPQPNGELWDLYLVRNSFGTWWGSGNGPYAGHALIRKDCVGQAGTGANGPSGIFSTLGVVPLYG